MLAYSQFHALSSHEQHAYVKTCGVYMVTRTVGSFLVDLYHVQGFYCEIWRQLPATTVVYLHTFTGQAGLYPYLGQISLPHSILA